MLAREHRIDYVLRQFRRAETFCYHAEHVRPRVRGVFGGGHGDGRLARDRGRVRDRGGVRDRGRDGSRVRFRARCRERRQRPWPWPGSRPRPYPKSAAKTVDSDRSRRPRQRPRRFTAPSAASGQRPPDLDIPDQPLAPAHRSAADTSALAGRCRRVRRGRRRCWRPVGCGRRSGDVRRRRRRHLRCGRRRPRACGRAVRL